MPDCVVRVSLVTFAIVTTYSIMCDPFRRCVVDSQIRLEPLTLTFNHQDTSLLEHHNTVHNTFKYTEMQTYLYMYIASPFTLVVPPQCHL